VRIGIVCYPTYGGSGAAATDLGRHLAARGHTVHLISYGRPFRMTKGYQENLFLHQIATVDYPVLRSELYTLSTAVKMAQLAEEQDLDILHSHYAVPHAVSAMLAKQICEGNGGKQHFKTVTTLHGTDITLVGSNPAFAPVVRMGIAHSDAVISVSHWLAGETERHFGLCKPCRIIHNFVDAEEFRPAPVGCRSKACFAPGSEKVLLHISNFRPVKRVGDVIRVFERVVREVPSVLLMVGDGPEHDGAVRLAQELGVADKVRFLGLQSDIATLLGIGDLFLFPSEYESFGLAVLEAMASELPVVCSNGGGLPEVMVQGETGYLCPVGDVETMAQRAIELLRDQALAREFGRAGRARACEKFSPQVALDAHEDLYLSLIGARD
jgi:N-acetyl-alpha-D-glucosaminyl L-malate synthase BshA